MKNNLLSLFSLTILIASLFWACDKNQQAVNVETLTVENTKVINPSNPNNPYDYCGELHNKGLKIVLEKFSYNLSNVSYKECLKAVDDAVKNVLIRDGKLMSKSTNLDEEELIALIKLLLNDIPNEYENFIMSLDYDYNTKIELLTFFKEIISMSEYEEITYEYIINKVLEFENKVINNDIYIIELDKEVVLTCAAILRYSLSLWADEEIRGGDAPKMKWYHWLILAGADAAGGSGGGVIGAIGCSSFALEVIKWDIGE